MKYKIILVKYTNKNSKRSLLFVYFVKIFKVQYEYCFNTKKTLTILNFIL